MLLCAMLCEIISGIRVQVTTQATSSISTLTGETNAKYALYVEIKIQSPCLCRCKRAAPKKKASAEGLK